MVTPLSGRTRSARKAKRSTVPQNPTSTATATATATATPRRRTRSTSTDLELRADREKDVQKLAELAEAKAAAKADAAARTSGSTTRSRTRTPSSKTKTKKKASAAAATPTPRRRTRSMSTDDDADDDDADDDANADADAKAEEQKDDGARKRLVLSPVAEQGDDSGDDNDEDDDDADGGKGEKSSGTTPPTGRNGGTRGGGGRGRRGRGGGRKNTSKKAKADDDDVGVGGRDVDGGNGGAEEEEEEEELGDAETEETAPPPPTRPDQQMDVAVHRIRHLNYIPRAIHRLAATPIPHINARASSRTGAGTNGTGAANVVPSASASAAAPTLCSSTTPSSYVAVSREGGAVELLAVDEKWRTVASVPGLKEREVDHLAWICGHGRRHRGADGTGGADMGRDIDTDDGTASTGRREHGTPAAAAAPAATATTTYTSPAHEESDRIHPTRRLFGASRDGTIFEVDFRARRHSHVTPTGGDGVLCLASICPECLCSSGGGGGNSASTYAQKKCGGYLAAGCGDGSIKIYRVYDDDDGIEGGSSPNKSLDLVSTLPSAGKPVLSLSWRSGARDDNLGVLGGSILYAGVADGTIRRYDCLSAVSAARVGGTSAHSISTGSVLSGTVQSGGAFRWRSTHRMTVETVGRHSSTKVWSVKALADGTVVSADSLGNVHFWDGHSGTLMCKFVQNENRSDVLDLAVSANECKIFASGVDCRVICIERIPPASAVPPLGSYQATGLHSHPSESKWVQSQAQRPHTHDVKSLCICHMKDSEGAAGAKPHAKGLGRELLVSGGIDTKLCTYLVSNFRKHRAKKLFPWPTSTPVSLARNRRLLALMRSDRIDIYSVASSVPVKSDSLDAPHIVDEEKTLVGSICVSSLYNLVCADISSDGRLLATSDGANLMVFSLNYVADDTSKDQREALVAKKLKVPKKARSACSAVKFANDGSWRLFCSTNKGSVKVMQIVNNDEKEEGNGDDKLATAEPNAVVLVHTFDERSVSSTSLTELYAASELAVSPDGEWLAASRYGMGSGSVTVYSVPKVGDNYKCTWSLPALEAPPSCIKFLGVKEAETLAVGCSNNSFYLFDHKEQKLSDWSQDTGFPMSPSMPRELIHRAEYPTRMAFNPSNPSKFLLVSTTKRVGRSMA